MSLILVIRPNAHDFRSERHNHATLPGVRRIESGAPHSSYCLLHARLFEGARDKTRFSALCDGPAIQPHASATAVFHTTTVPSFRPWLQVTRTA
jgi:hypothetical protein